MSIVPFLWSPFKGPALVFMIVYVWSRENPNARVSIHGLVEIKGFYLPWVLLGIDTIIGNPWKPGLEGIAAGHVYYFLTVLHPLAGGKNYCKTPLLVYPNSFSLVKTPIPQSFLCSLKHVSLVRSWLHSGVKVFSKTIHTGQILMVVLLSVGEVSG